MSKIRILVSEIPDVAHTTPMTVTLDSRATFWFVAGCACLYAYALLAHWSLHKWSDALYPVLGLMFPYALWVLTYVVAIEPKRIVVKRAFGLVEPLVVPMSDVTELRSRPNSNGKLSRFEIWTQRGCAVQLHMFQTNFLDGVAAIRGVRADIPEQVVSKWSL